MGNQADPSERVDKAAGRARGGIVRAQRMTQAERSRQAREAAAARWHTELSEVICGSPDKPLRIGDVRIECYVLEDGTRVVTQQSFLQALGRHPKATAKRAGNELPAMLQARSLEPFISDDTRATSKPIPFRLPTGGRGLGHNALLVPKVCEIYLAARSAGALPRNQEHVALQAEILIRGLAHVGIIALVDEATGYQDLRAKNALARILEEFIDKELRPWVKTFPDDFYREMFRLRGLTFPDSDVQRPKYFGLLTNDIVYKRLAPGVLAELRRVTPKDGSGRPKHKYFQRLTTNVGYPKLREHLASVVTVMKLSDDWYDFQRKLDRIHPRIGDTIPLPLDVDNGRGL